GGELASGVFPPRPRQGADEPRCGEPRASLADHMVDQIGEDVGAGAGRIEPDPPGTALDAGEFSPLHVRRHGGGAGPTTVDPNENVHHSLPRDFFLPGRASAVTAPRATAQHTDRDGDRGTDEREP